MFETPGAIKILSKLLQAGMAAWDAFQSEGIGSKEVTSIRLATELLGDLGGMSSGMVADMEALHAGVITQCFGHSLGRQWAFNKLLAPRGFRLFMGREQRERADEIDLRVKLAFNSIPKFGTSLQQAGDLPASVDELRRAAVITEPLATPYYKALWNAFSNPKLDEGEERKVPLLDLEKGRLGFERDFLLAYHQALASAEGQKLHQYVVGVAGDYRVRMLRELLLRDMVGWGERHTFGNLEWHDRIEGDPIPFMPLEKVYVEPNACLAAKPRKQAGGPPKSVLSLIEHWLRKSETNAVVVRADFGMGKSLTARSLTQRLARQFLEVHTPSPEVEMPVFIRCADDMTEEGFDLDQFVRRAWKREASELGLKLKLDDPALAPPSRTQRALFIFDGLDEVILGERRLESFFRRIKDAASENHRFIIFSRPGALPAEQELEGIPVLEIQPWNEQQLSIWLNMWRGVNEGVGPTPSDLHERGLSELARTPILLFMIAQTWKGWSHDAGAGRATLYEEFFWQIARGKHEADGMQHKNVATASMVLLERLLKKGLILEGSQPPDAMLWLMGRVAWEATKLDQRQMIEPSRRAEVLTKHGITNLIIEDLQLEGNASDVLDAIQVGLLLTLQAHLNSGNASQILFGHKSFREFLVARYWSDRLRAIARASAREREEIEISLLGGRLLSREDQSFNFLLEMLDGDAHSRRPTAPLGLTVNDRSALFDWAQSCFESEEPAVAVEHTRRLSHRRCPAFRDDRRPWLREAALAIGSRLRGSRGLRSQDNLTLRSMIAWFLLMRTGAIIVAPRAHLTGALLADLDLRGADFSEANLEGATLVRASCGPPDWARDFYTDFSRAVLDRAVMHSADFRHARFTGASLRNARMMAANMVRAVMTGACLENANMAQANLERSVLDASNLASADLSKANLVRCSLKGAILRKTVLRGADLSRADLTDAILEEADLQGAIYSNGTRWPVGFRPEDVGARIPRARESRAEE